MDKRGSQPKVITKKHMARLEREKRQINIIRGIAIGGIIVVVGLIVFGYLQLNVFSKQQAVATVNGVKIATGQWQERVRLERVSLYNQLNQYQYFQQAFGMDTSQQQQQIQLQLDSTDTLGQSVLNNMIDDVLIRQEAEKRGIKVSPADVDKFIQEAYQFYPDGSPTPTITPTAFSYPTLNSSQLTIYPPTQTPTLAPTSTPDVNATATPASTPTSSLPTPTFVPEQATATSTPYTLEGFKSTFQKTLDQFKTYGISEQTLRNVYEAQILRNKLMDEQEKDLPTTDTQVLARHILVDTEEEAKKMEDLLKSGQDFGALAKQYSKDTGSGQNGGELGWAPASSYVPEFAAAVKTLKIGEISQPVKTQFGYHIIQVIAREDLPLTADELQAKKQTAFTDWLKSVHDSAKINIYDIWKTRVPTEPVLNQQQQP
jgi:peptidyl-prolyl cis-trans isomerase D